MDIKSPRLLMETLLESKHLLELFAGERAMVRKWEGRRWEGKRGEEMGGKEGRRGEEMGGEEGRGDGRGGGERRQEGRRGEEQRGKGGLYFSGGMERVKTSEKSGDREEERGREKEL